MKVGKHTEQEKRLLEQEKRLLAAFRKLRHEADREALVKQTESWVACIHNCRPKDAAA